MLKKAIIQRAQDSLQSKLQKLQKQIYRPYESVLGSQNQLNIGATTSLQQITKCQSLQLKTKQRSNQSSLKNSLFHKKRSVKLPSILKKNSVILSEEQQRQASINDFVSDPFLNGRIRHQREQIYKKMEEKENICLFLRTVEKYEAEFLELCFYKKFKEAEEIIARLLNYSIDLNLINQLCFSLKILADFHFNSLQFDKSFFYYNQCRKCAMLIGQNKLMAQSLIQMGVCAHKNNLHLEAIRLFKKALQYVWYYDLVNLQLRVYDEIGKAYYLMGDLQQAKHFHYKFFTGGIQSKDSSIRLLSKQSLVLEGLQKLTRIKNITSVFLWMIHIPVRNCEALQQFLNPENRDHSQGSPRKGYSKDMRYFSEFRSIKQAVYKIFEEDFFKNELGDMHFHNNDWTVPIRIKKYLSLDIQRNNHLKSLGIPFENYFFKGKQSKYKKGAERDRRIKTQCKQKMEDDRQSKDIDKWFENLALQAMRRYKHKNSGMLNRVNMRGKNKPFESKTAIFRSVYNQYFDLVNVQ